MAEHSRYNASNSQAGIDGPVLKNKLGITDPQELMDAETLLLNDAYEYFFTKLFEDDLQLSAETIFDLHEYIFNPLYDWAGQLRTVDISKDGMLFAPVAHLQQSIQQMQEMIKNHIPTEEDTITVIARKIAVIHNEYNATHPFREGNGRTIRLYIDLLVVSIGYQSIDYTKVDHNHYINACIAGMNQDHTPMKTVLRPLLKK